MKPLAAVVAVACLAGCLRHEDPPTAAVPVGTPIVSGERPGAGLDPVQDLVGLRLAELTKKIESLEQQLATPSRKATGALAGGPRLRIEGGSQEALLDRLRRLEKDLAVAQATITAKEARIHNLEVTRADLQATSTDLTRKNDYLNHTESSLTTAQQALAERQERISQLEAQLTSSELARLRAEREHYLLAAEVLRLTPEQAAALPEIQSRIREQARNLLPAKATP